MLVGITAVMGRPLGDIQALRWTLARLVMVMNMVMVMVVVMVMVMTMTAMMTMMVCGYRSVYPRPLSYVALNHATLPTVMHPMFSPR